MDRYEFKARLLPALLSSFVVAPTVAVLTSDTLGWPSSVSIGGGLGAACAVGLAYAASAAGRYYEKRLCSLHPCCTLYQSLCPSGHQRHCWLGRNVTLGSRFPYAKCGFGRTQSHSSPVRENTPHREWLRSDPCPFASKGSHLVLYASSHSVPTAKQVPDLRLVLRHSGDFGFNILRR